MSETEIPTRDIEEFLNVITTEFRHRSEEMNRLREQKVNGIESDFNRRGMLNSSVCCEAILHVCVEDIRSLADSVFETGIDYARQAAFGLERGFLVRFSGHAVGLVEQEWVKQRGQLGKRRYLRDYSYEKLLKDNVSPIIARLTEKIELVGKRTALGIGVKQGSPMEFHSLSISQAGVVNFGMMYGQIEGHVTALNQSGAEEVASAFKKLIEAIDKSDLGVAQKREVLELASELSEQAQEPKESRKTAVAQAIYEKLIMAIQTYPALEAIWQSVGPIIKGYLGLQ